MKRERNVISFTPSKKQRINTANDFINDDGYESGDERDSKASTDTSASYKLVECSSMVEMTDSTAEYLAGNYEAVRRRLINDGYVLIRGVIPMHTIMPGRNLVLSYLKQRGALKLDEREDTIAVDANGKYHAGFTIDADTGG